MDYKLNILPEAHHGINSIHDYISLYCPDTADKIVDRIHNAIQEIFEYPSIGSSVAHRFNVKSDYRYYVAKGLPYLIFFKIEDETIIIARVIHGKRDIVALLDF